MQINSMIVKGAQKKLKPSTRLTEKSIQAQEEFP